MADLIRGEKRKIWMRQPSEHGNAWEAFNVYLNLAPLSDDPELRRTLKNVAKRMELSESQVTQWSASNGWVQRAKAFDDDKALATFNTQVVDLATLQRSTLYRESEEVAVLEEIVHEYLRGIKDIVDGGLEPPTAKEVQNALTITKSLQDMRRRLAQLPVTFIQGVADDKTDDANEPAKTYIIKGE